MSKEKVMVRNRLVVEIVVEDFGLEEEIFGEVDEKEWEEAVEDYILDELLADKVTLLESQSDIYEKDENGKFTKYVKTLLTQRRRKDDSTTEQN